MSNRRTWSFLTPAATAPDPVHTLGKLAWLFILAVCFVIAVCGV